MEIYIGLGVVALIIIFFAVILIRTARFKPKKLAEIDESEVVFDKDRAVETLAQIVKCKTVSNVDRSLEDDAEFDKLISLLPSLFPKVFKNCQYLQFEDRGLLFKLSGKSHDNPTVFMAHYDVVPALAERWEKPPFSAEIENGVLWGRGTLDTKITFSNSLLAIETLLEQGFVPENDIYLAYSGNEEVMGKGAQNIVDYFEKEGIVPALVLDEGGAVVSGVFPGVKEPCGLIGIAEKGLVEVEYKVNSNGGHASAPKPHTPIGILADAVCKVENNPFPFYLTKPVSEMFNNLGRHSSFVYRLIFANLWLFKGILNSICKKGGGEMNALVRTTVAFTMAKGSDASNVIPPEASVVSNIRLNPMDTVDGAIERLKKTINNEKVEVSAIRGYNPSRISTTDSVGYKKVANAIASTWKGALVSPYLMVQCSDSRHYGKISDKVYRFSSMDLTSEERASIHGNNEKIRLETIYKSLEFYIRLAKNC